MHRQIYAPTDFYTPRRLFIWSLALTSFVCLPSTFANSQYPSFAEVVGVESISQNVRKPIEVKRCRWEQLPDQVRYERFHPDRYSHTKRIIERRAKRCRTVTEYRVRKITTGYNVTLNYQGETFTRHMLQRPGSRVPVSVEVAELTPQSNTNTHSD